MLIALVLKALFGAKVIFDMRGIFVDEVVEAGIIRAGTVIHAFERATEKLYMHKADVMVAVSQPHRDYLARLARDPAMAERCYVIPNSTDPAKFERVKPLKGSSMIRLLYVGQHVVKYDMDGVFEFFRVLTQQHPESYLRIVTYGPPQKLVEKIRSLPEAIQKRVEITNADSQDVPDKMNDSSAGMLLLHDTVGNRVSAPIKLAEYLAAGMPIIVSENIGDAETIIKKYGVGVIVRNKEYESAIRTLVNLLDTPDIEKRCRLAIAGDLSMESSCMKYMELYQLLATPIAKKG
jgi:glycosyltransferase involved in cell wall biosynthesis